MYLRWIGGHGCSCGRYDRTSKILVRESDETWGNGPIAKQGLSLGLARDLIFCTKQRLQKDTDSEMVCFRVLKVQSADLWLVQKHCWGLHELNDLQHLFYYSVMLATFGDWGSCLNCPYLTLNGSTLVSCNDSQSSLWWGSGLQIVVLPLGLKRWHSWRMQMSVF